MVASRRTWLVLGFAVLLAAAFVAYLQNQVSQRQRAAVIESAIQNGPLMISVSRLNPFRSSWNLDVDAAGNATLDVESFSAGERMRQFAVSKAQLEELRKTLLREGFFDLASSYGDLTVCDGSATTLEVDAGDLTKTIELHDLGVPTQGERDRLRDPSRALRVLQVILAGFDDPDLNEMRKSDQKLIEAAGK